MKTIHVLGLAVLILLSLALQGGPAPAYAQTITTVGFDMIPTGNSCPNTGMDDCTLGPIDGCVEVPVNATIQFDVFLQGIPAPWEYPGPRGLGSVYYGFNVSSSGPGPVLTAASHMNPLVNLLVQRQSLVADISDALPYFMFPFGPFRGGALDPWGAEYNPPFTRGVLGRYTLNLGELWGFPGLPADVYRLTFVPWLWGLGDEYGQSIFDPGGFHADGSDSDLDGTVDEDQVWDANFIPRYGLIAVGVPCPVPVSTPTGADVEVALSTAATVAFASVSTSGDTTLITTSSGPMPPSGFTLGTPPTYYDISTTAAFTGPVTVCVNYGDQFGAHQSDLALLHFENDAWADVTTSHDPGSTTICGQVSSLSPFLVARPQIAPVGGTVHLQRDASAPSTSASDSPGVPYAALAAAAAAALAISAGAWYARRRWLR